MSLISKLLNTFVTVLYLSLMEKKTLMMKSTCRRRFTVVEKRVTSLLTSVAQLSALRALEEEVSGPFPARSTLGNNLSLFINSVALEVVVRGILYCEAR